MSSDIKSCPKCQAIILDDTNVCPACACQLEETVQVAQRELESVDVKCDECGEMVAEGSVRCWNCSAFMRRDTEIAMWQSQLNSIEVNSDPQSQGANNSDDPYAQPKAKSQPAPAPQEKQEPTRPAVDLSATAEAGEDKMAGTASFVLGADETIADDDADFELGEGVEMYDDPEPATSEAPTTIAGTGGVDELEIPSLVDLDEADAKSADDEAKTDSQPSGAVPPVQTPPVQAPPVQAPPVQAPPVQEPPVQSDGGEEDGVAHSVATAGDLLLQIAMEEESEFGSSSATGDGEIPPPVATDEADGSADEDAGNQDAAGEEKTGADEATDDPQPAKGKPRRATVTITCSNGHTVKVSAKNRGRKGKCPKCKVAIAIPADAPVTGGAAPAETWVRDIRLHAVKVESVKLKPGALERDFSSVDVRFSPEGLLVVRLNKKKGLFGSSDKQAMATRDAVTEHLQAGKPLKDLANDGHVLINADEAEKVRVIEPVVYEHESVFKAIPVFGEKQIAVQLNTDNEGITNFLSFGLMKFREFARAMSAHFNVTDMGIENGVPLVDESNSFACHYSDESFEALTDSAFHRHDSNVSLKVVGWRCESCELIVSEDSRKKEKIGGLNGKSIAKAKCPKCEERFGDHPLHIIVK